MQVSPKPLLVMKSMLGTNVVELWHLGVIRLASMYAQGNPMLHVHDLLPLIGSFPFSDNSRPLSQVCMIAI